MAPRTDLVRVRQADNTWALRYVRRRNAAGTGWDGFTSVAPPPPEEGDFAAAVLAHIPDRGYLKLGEAVGNNVADDAYTTNFDGTYVGPTRGVTGLIAGDAGTAASFDGVDDRITWDGQYVHKPAGSFAVSFLIKASGVLAQQCIYSEASHTDADPVFMITTGLAGSEGLLRCFIRSDAGAVFINVSITNTEVIDNRVHHIALNFFADRWECWVDGRRDKVGAFGAGLGTLTLTRAAIGARTGSAFTQFFAGTLQHFARYLHTLTDAQIAAQVAAAGIENPDTPPPVTAVTVHSLWAASPGSDDPGRINVTARMTPVSLPCRLAISTSATLSNPTYSPVVTADAQGSVKLSIASLIPDTQYHYGIEADGNLTALRGKVVTAPSKGVQKSFLITFGNCAEPRSNAAIFNTIRNDQAPMWLMLDDPTYWHRGGGPLNLTAPASPMTVTDFRNQFNAMHLDPNPAGLFRDRNVFMLLGDHGYGADNLAAGAPTIAPAQQVYQERVPHPPLPNAGTLSFSVGWGRALLIFTDGRAARSGATMLGTTQKTWVKAQFARTDYELKIICMEGVWNASSSETDEWGGFISERNELADYFTASGHGFLLILGGSMHGLAYTDGSSSNSRGIVEFHGGSIDQGGSTKGGPWVQVQEGGNRYGRVQVTDAGTSIQAAFQGRSGTTTSMSHTRTYELVPGSGGGGEEEPPPPPPPVEGEELWLSAAEIAALPTSGTAFNTVKSAADASWGSADTVDNNCPHNTFVLAGAFIYARLGGSTYLNKVKAGLQSVMGESLSGPTSVTAPARQLAAYVVAADLINLAQADPSLDADFRSWITSFMNFTFRSNDSIRNVARRRPNNIGCDARASNVAGAAYLGRTSEVNELAAVCKGYAGDRGAYDNFEYSSPFSWHFDESRMVGINPPGSTKQGRNIDGVVPDDQRRSGGFSWPAPKENYVWVAMNGECVASELLHRKGHDAWQWSSQAIKRVFEWKHNVNDHPPEGDDRFLPWLANYAYGTSYPTTASAPRGKTWAWTQWTNAGVRP